MDLNELKRTIQSEYANSLKLMSFLEGGNDFIDPNKDIEKWRREVFDLSTCGPYGLKIWSRIVAAPRILLVEDSDYFGFQGQDLPGFDQSPFFGDRPTSSAVEVQGEALRRLIYYKAYVNNINTTLPEIDKALWLLLGEGRPLDFDIYTQEHHGGPMTMRIVIRGTLSPFDRALLRTYGYLLRPAAVGFGIYEIPYQLFGFYGSEFLPFDNAPFWAPMVGEIK